jgi:hypothetical protein
MSACPLLTAPRANLLDQGHLQEARSLSITARDRTHSAGRGWIARRAQEWLDRL